MPRVYLALIFTPALFFYPGFALASTTVEVSNNGANARTNVSVESNTGNNTICQNGVCVPSGSVQTGTSKVCVNGQCYTSEDGNLNVQSENGNTKVNINSNSSQNSPTETIVSDSGALSPTTIISQDSNTAEDEEPDLDEDKNPNGEDNFFTKIFKEIKNIFKNLHLF